MQSRREHHEPTCVVAHNLRTILTALVGQCDLLESMTVPGTEIAKKLAVIRRMAQFAVNEVKEHQPKADAAT